MNLPEQAPDPGATPEAAGGPPLSEATRAWFTLRSQPKHEHIAAAHLVHFDDVEVFNPRIRFPRSTRRGPVWVTEALFPGYLFARFDWKMALSKVRYAQGVSGVVHFGHRWPTIPDAVILDLKQTLGEKEVHEISPTIVPGDHIRVSGGLFHGLQAVVTRVMPGRQRVAILLEFLGRQTAVEISVNAVVREGFHPLAPG
jgi:transcriptional antiterminator RfaH